MTWSARSWRVIEDVHRSLPETATYEERRKALFDAYPFGIREHFPYKAWCKAQKTYLARYLPKSKQATGPLFGNGGEK
jgi:hypothetical protein